MLSKRGVALVVANPELATALLSLLSNQSERRVSAITSPGDAPPAAIVLATTAECSVAECAGLAQEGRDVVILAAVPSAYQEATYRAAGAAGYLPMILDTGPLLATIDSLG